MITKNINIKSTLLIVVIMLFAVVTNAQIEMNSAGNVGIGVTPGSQDLRVGSLRIDGTNHYVYTSSANIYTSRNNYGSIGTSSYRFGTGNFRYLYANGVYLGSDERIKRNKKQLSNSLNRVKKVKGYSYDLLCNDTLSDANQIGFLAQELLKEFPEMVVYDSVIDQYSVNYIAMIPVLLEAIKEQQEQIDALQIKSNNSNKNKSATLGDVNAANTLAQNAPNPFTEQTSISYTLAESVNDAMICIYDMHGTQLKCYALSLEGSGSITINGHELVAGMYMYALIADGQLIDTKNMVLTE